MLRIILVTCLIFLLLNGISHSNSWEQIPQPYRDPTLSIITVPGSGVADTVYFGSGIGLGYKERRYPKAVSLLVQMLEFYNLGPQLCYKSLIHVREMSIEIIRNNGIKNGVSQVFQPFIVYQMAILAGS